MSSIPAGDWLNPSGDGTLCDFRGCGRPATRACWVVWHVDGSLSLQLASCADHWDAAADSFLVGTNVQTDTGEYNEVTL